MSIIKNNFQILIFGIVLLNVVFFLVTEEVFADIGPVDTKSQDVEHGRDESGDENDDKDDDKKDYVKLSKDKYTPRNLRIVFVGEDRVKLSWEDKAKQEAGYYVERKKSGETWRFLAKIGRSSENYDDLTVVSGTTYYYRVKAFNGKRETSWSNETSTKTKGITLEEKIKLEKEEALETQEKELKKEFEVTLKKKIEDTRIEILSQAVTTCNLSDVSTKEVDKVFRERCEDLTGEKIGIDEPTKLESVKNKLLYDTKFRLIIAGMILFIIMNNVLWHIRHKTVKNKLEGEF